MGFFKSKLTSAEFTKLIKFAITGVMNTAVDYIVFTILIYFGLSTSIAQVFSYSAGIVNSYTINRSWTFKSEERYISRQLLKFLAVNIVIMLVSVGVIYIFETIIGLPVMLAKLCTVGVTVVLGFILNRLLVF